MQKPTKFLGYAIFLISILSSEPPEPAWTAECGGIGPTLPGNYENDWCLDDLEIHPPSGTTALSTCSSYRFTTTGGSGLYKWSTSGAEGETDDLQVDGTGLLTLSADVYGSFTLQVEDIQCQKTISIDQIINPTTNPVPPSTCHSREAYWHVVAGIYPNRATAESAQNSAFDAAATQNLHPSMGGGGFLQCWNWDSAGVPNCAGWEAYFFRVQVPGCNQSGVWKYQYFLYPSSSDSLRGPC